MWHSPLTSPFSTLCCGCSQSVIDFHSKRLCRNCYKKLITSSPPYCTRCGFTADGILDICSQCQKQPEFNWKQGISLFEMSGHGKKLIHSFKYHNNFQLSSALSTLAIERIKEHSINVDIVTAIPLHWIKHFRRGYNQSELISSRLAKALNCRHEQLLYRKRHTKPQAHLPKEERRSNLLNAFCIKRRANCQNCSILLVDDVITTGATLTEATKVLLNTGAHDVTVLAIARR